MQQGQLRLQTCAAAPPHLAAPASPPSQQIMEAKAIKRGATKDDEVRLVEVSAWRCSVLACRPPACALTWRDLHMPGATIK